MYHLNWNYVVTYNCVFCKILPTLGKIFNKNRDKKKKKKKKETKRKIDN